MSHVSLELPAVANWHRLDVCCSDALAHTRVRVIGALDTRAVGEIDLAVLTAEVHEHSLDLDLGQVSSVTPQAMQELLARGRRPQVTFAR
jgi:hypothetical protein